MVDSGGQPSEESVRKILLSARRARGTVTRSNGQVTNCYLAGAWFWSERWQQLEREVDEHIERGELERFDSSDDFLSSLDKVESEG